MPGDEPGQVRIGLHIVRIQQDRLLVCVAGLIEPAQFHVGHAQVVEGVNETGR